MPSSLSPSSSDRISSLDGLRAASILLVLISHSIIALTRHARTPLPAIATPGAVGVSVFFGISGFIITALLVQEHSRTGHIDLRGFYIRRAFRILPALWAFLGVTALVAPPMGSHNYLGALLFVTDYWLPANWWLGHTWSLSIEEQFYLLWPVVLLYLGPGRALRVAVLLVAGAPAVRVACYFAFPALRDQVAYNFHTNVDAIMVGCLVALIRANHPQGHVLRFLRHGAVAAFGTVFLLVFNPILSDFSPGRYVLSIGLSLRALSVGAMIAWAVSSASGPVVWILNSRPAVHIGHISYGLYLWQQPFFNPSARGHWLASTPAAVLGAFAVAELSYRVIERPALAIRNRLARQHPRTLLVPRT